MKGTTLELLDRTRRASDVHEQQVEEPQKDTQEDITEPLQKRLHNVVPGTTKEHLFSLVQTDPNESIQFICERVSIPRHNLRKLVKNMKQQGLGLEKKPRRRKPLLTPEDSKAVVDAFRNEAATTLEELQVIVTRRHAEQEGSHAPPAAVAVATDAQPSSAAVGVAAHDSDDAQQGEQPPEPQLLLAGVLVQVLTNSCANQARGIAAARIMVSSLNHNTINWNSVVTAFVERVGWERVKSS